MARKQQVEWPIAEAAIVGARLSLLYGPPATGKTTAAVLAGNPKLVYNVTLSDETPAAELRGHWLPGETWQWLDGPAMEAFRNGGRLVLNEIDKASADALDFLHALLDDPGVSAITLPVGQGAERTVRPHPDFQVVATMNGNPLDLPEALRSRFAVKLEILTPHPKAIESLPEDLRAIASDSVVDPEDERPTDLRAWKTFADLREQIGAEQAAAAIFAHKATEILDTLKLAGAR